MPLSLLTRVCVTCLFISVVASGHAEPVDQPIEEIVVSADFRGRTTTDLPASITVFDTQQLEQRAIQHFEELIYSVPNLNWSGDGNRARYLQIRGVGELEQYQGAPNPSVGFLIDDIDFSGIGTVATLFDLQQVEVLRGPQGTRYGANALAGLIYMQSAVPQPEWGSRAQVMLADDNTWSLGLAGGGALNERETLLFRASVQQYRGDGFRRNPYLQRNDSNGRDELTFRSKLRWLVSPDWQLDLALMFADIDDGYDAFALDNSYTVLSDQPGEDAQQSTGASLRAEYDGWENVGFTSITAVADSDIRFSFDADWGNTDSWAPVTYDYVSRSDRQRSTVSQEFRWVATNWLAGLYGMRLRDELTTVDQGEYYDPFYDFADSLDARFSSDYEATNLAAFGQYDWQLSAATRLTIGARIEQRSTDYVDISGLRADPSETMFGGEVSLQHQHTASVNSFVTLSKGYKAGGFNLGVVPDNARNFDAEDMWNIEAGIKSSWPEQGLWLNASVFYALRKDQQVRTSFQIDPGDPTAFVFFTDNAAEGETLGFESELRWQPSVAWDLSASLGLLDARFDRFRTPQVDLSDRRQAHAPSTSLALGGQYSHPSGFFARLDATYRSEFFFDVSHNQKSEAYELVNGRIGFERGNWLAQLWVRNLFDSDYAVRGFFFGNEPPDFPATLYTRLGDPRQVGFTVDVNF